MSEYTFEVSKEARARHPRPIRSEATLKAYKNILRLAKIESAPELGELCEVSRQTASKWWNHPEQSLSWDSLEKITARAYERDAERCKSSVILAARAEIYLALCTSIIALDATPEETQEFEAEMARYYIIQAAQQLDHERLLALSRVAIDMLTSYEVGASSDLFSKVSTLTSLSELPTNESTLAEYKDL